MPPVRTMPAAKPVKTERTHEENQERAYIAASRRSDRSLEARVESARRASEIHKRRTGRSLRVREEDVVNEEMYEEEDDDLPMQYRRLTAHLQTQNADFDRRLAAYLTNHVAMRTALGNAVTDQWQQGQQFMNPSQFMQPQQQQQQQQQQGMANYGSNSMLPPQMMHRNSTSHRQSPYPTPGNAKSNWHGRSMSIATPQDPNFQRQGSQSQQTSPVESKIDERRMSVPVSTAVPQTPQPQTGRAQSTSPQHVSPALSRNSSSSNLPAQNGLSRQSPQQQSAPLSRTPAFPSPSNTSSQYSQDMSNQFNPLSMQLPMESQQLLGGSGFTNTWDAMMMPNQFATKPAQPFYSYNPNGRRKGSGSNSSNNASPTDEPSQEFKGMNQTLAPSALDSGNNASNYDPSASFAPSMFSNNFDADMFNPAFSTDPFKMPSGGNSGELTPLGTDGDWGDMINFFPEQSLA
ncbi:hypothetical protein MBLNU230_g1394t1 [Neophaeotheca triangularis]